MSILSHQDIAMSCAEVDISSVFPLIQPYQEEQLQPASYDVRLDKRIVLYDSDYNGLAGDLQESGWLLSPGDFALGVTMETLHIPNNLAARFEGKSTLGRSGLMTHLTAGFIDPGFCGTLTVELACVHPKGIMLYPGMRIGQLSFFELTQRVEVGYGEKGHYQNQGNAPVLPIAESYLT